MNKEIKDNLSSIQNLLLQHKVQHAYLFGNAAKNEMKIDSDIDILIQFSKELDIIEYGTNYFELLYALQDLLKREVDLVAEETITNPYLRKSIDSNKIAIL